MRERARITEAHGDLIVLEMLRDYFRARLRSGQSNNTRDTYLFFVAKLSVMIDKFDVLDKHLAKIKKKRTDEQHTR